MKNRKWSKSDIEGVLERYKNYPGDKKQFFIEENISRHSFFGLKRRYRLKYLENNSALENLTKSYPKIVTITPVDNRLTLELGNHLKVLGNTDEISRLILKLNLLK